MQIKDMFRKKIDREIQGVIIVGQGEETNVAQELEEYVVTVSLSVILQISLQHIKKVFREAHRKWVSGFPASLEVVNLIF